MRHADRLFRLVQLLRRDPITTAAQLAEELGVSVRTIYRDIRALERSGVPVEGEAGVGYRLNPGQQLPPITFTTPELEALSLGIRMVRAWGDEELADAATASLRKIEGVLSRPLREALEQTVLFAPFGWRAATAGLGDLRHAIADRRKVSFAYINREGEQSQRVVRPLGLYFWGRSWSLAAWCELRSDWRSFRPDRMQSLQILEETFDPGDGIDLAGFVRAAQHERSESGG
ncbi:MAG TPA: YafY family transcriptional regulator [Deltaproteobacteria bacterium]|nr:YafY family transcriptional regulator [Deltaproteobacteria bacterium]